MGGTIKKQILMPITATSIAIHVGTQTQENLIQ